MLLDRFSQLPPSGGIHLALRVTRAGLRQRYAVVFQSQSGYRRSFFFLQARGQTQQQCLTCGELQFRQGL